MTGPSIIGWLVISFALSISVAPFAREMFDSQTNPPVGLSIAINFPPGKPRYTTLSE